MKIFNTMKPPFENDYVKKILDENEKIRNSMTRIEYEGTFEGTLRYYKEGELLFEIEAGCYGFRNDNELKSTLFEHNIKENEFQELLKKDCPYVYNGQGALERMVDAMKELLGDK
jgi:hypothetical protein